MSKEGSMNLAEATHILAHQPHHPTVTVRALVGRMYQEWPLDRALRTPVRPRPRPRGTKRWGHIAQAIAQYLQQEQPPMPRVRRRHRIPSTVLVNGARRTRDAVMVDALPELSWDIIYQRLARDHWDYMRAVRTAPGEKNAEHWLAQSIAREACPWLYHDPRQEVPC